MILAHVPEGREKAATAAAIAKASGRGVVVVRRELANAVKRGHAYCEPRIGGAVFWRPAPSLSAGEHFGSRPSVAALSTAPTIELALAYGISERTVREMRRKLLA